MIILIRYIAAFTIGVLCLLFSACNLVVGYDTIRAEGAVSTKTRTVEPFNKINVSQGLRLIILNENSRAIKVQTNENLHDIIITEVKDNTLIIRTTKQIRKADAKNIMVPVADLNAIKASSGATVRANQAIKTTAIDLKASSGSSINMVLDTKDLRCTSSSGSSIRLKGSSANITATSSSGSTINAIDLQSTSCEANSSSGATIRLNCTSSIAAKASSGSSIKYDGSPTEKNVKKSSGASVKAI
jgi:hypothetical protein